jgi:hypothetical protein
MRDKLFYYFHALFLVFLTACSSCSLLKINDTVYDETPNTPSPVIATETIEPTSVVYPDTEIIKECVTMIENPMAPEGVFVVIDYDTIKFELYNMKRDSVITIGDFGTGHEISGMFAISPDFQRIAYVDRYNSSVIIINSSGKRLLTKQVPREIE